MEEINVLVRKDKHAGCGVGQHIIPSSTSVAKEVGKVLPELHGKFIQSYMES
jgi:glyceraldehyde-3-phosphate dehydrogenase/erythrose-4-phosphate dehydrogenase